MAKKIEEIVLVTEYGKEPKKEEEKEVKTE